MTHILYLHGAGASPVSFTRLISELPEHHPSFVAYTTDEHVSDVISRAESQITGFNEPTIVIGHSLGGVIASGLTDLFQVKKLVTLCAPFGGIHSANLMRCFSRSPLFGDLAPHGGTMRRLRAHPINCPHLAIIGTSGLPLPPEPNDGVVTVASQTALKGPDYRHFPLNHFEVLLSDDVVAAISDFITDEVARDNR